VQVNGITNATDISAHGYQTCALLSTGRVECWGSNIDGQLGNGTTTGPDCGGSCSATPVQVSGITNATAIAAGEDHVCALLSTGQIDCWGASARLGNGTTTGPDCGGFCSATPVQVSGITSATAIAAGRDDTCAVLVDGSLNQVQHIRQTLTGPGRYYLAVTGNEGCVGAAYQLRIGPVGALAPTPAPARRPSRACRADRSAAAMARRAVSHWAQLAHRYRRGARHRIYVQRMHHAQRQLQAALKAGRRDCH
jgi:hypothetical protein